MHLIETFDRGAHLAPERDCFVTLDGSQSWSYAETHDISHRIAHALKEKGLSDGGIVGVLSANDAVAFMCVLGALRAGGVWLGINALSTSQDIGDLMDLTGCEVLFYAPDKAQDAEYLAERAGIRTLVCTYPGGRDGDPVLEDWMSPAGTRVPLPSEDPNRTVLLMGTGGTTGKPKGVQIPNRAIVTVGQAIAAHMHEDEPPVQLLAAPMTHGAGVIMFVVFSFGGTHVVHRGVKAEEIFESIERHKVTRLFLPPTAIYGLLAHPDVRNHDYSSLKHFIYAAAPMSVDKLKEAIEVFGPVMAQCFGQAEVPMVCTYMSPQDHVRALEEKPDRLASCGLPSIVATVSILDDDGHEVPQGERGEICVRSDLRMNGYLSDPEQTAECDKGNGWHGTSDIGFVDEDGYVYIVDRKRDMIITGGFNVFPSEVEQVIWGHPAVNDCAVIGLPDDKWGETVTAAVELKDGETVEDAEIIKLCRDRLGAVKTPKSVIFRELPRSPVGKVLKRKLRDEFWEGSGRAV